MAGGPLGLDMDSLTGAIQQGLGDLFGRDFAGGNAFAGVSYGGNDPFKGVQYGGDPFAGVTYGSGPLDWGGQAQLNPFESGNPYLPAPVIADAQQRLDARRAKDEQSVKDATIGRQVSDSPTYGNPGAGFGAPTVQQLDRELTGSPLDGYGATIARLAAQYGVPVAVAMGILRQESSYGRAPAQGTRYNFGGLKGSGGQGPFADFASADQGLDAVIANMGSALYQGKSLRDFIMTYAPPGDGNDTEAYIANMVAQVNRFGGNATPDSVVITPRQAPAPTPQGGALGRLPAITHGTGQVMQDFGRTGYAEANAQTYAYATQFGMQPGQHTGIDWGVQRGTQTYSPVGGVVRIAGGSGYYKDQGGDGPGRGELRLALDDGSELILGHMANISVRVGQRINAGDLVGLSGGSDGDHIHIEYRIKDPSTPSGWRIVSPLDYLR